MPAPVGIVPPSRVCAAHTKARTPVSAVNQTIFFPSTVKSSIPQTNWNVRLALEDCQFGLPLALGRILWRCSISAFAFISLFFPHMLSSPSQGEFFMSVNKVILVGRLGRDPETRYTGAARAVANFSMATDESYKDKNGERQKPHRVDKIVVWSKLAEIAQQYLKKRLSSLSRRPTSNREWQDKEVRSGQPQRLLRPTSACSVARRRRCGRRRVAAAAARSSDEMESHAAPADDSYGGSGSRWRRPEIPTKIFPFKVQIPIASFGCTRARKDCLRPAICNSPNPQYPS